MSYRNDNKSILTLSSFRIDFIKYIFKKGKIEPLINNFDNTCDTETFINPMDTREVLGKQNT